MGSPNEMEVKSVGSSARACLDVEGMKMGSSGGAMMLKQRRT